LKALRIYQVDAFTTQLFAGNPAAVVPLDDWIDDSLMQQIAAENNLAETAFFVPQNDSGDHWHIRWFTPAVEVPLCGHATLASAAVIHRDFSPASWPIRLESASGQLTVDVDGDAFVLDFPANEAAPCEVPDGLLEVLGIEVEECFSTEGFYLLVAADEAGVQAMSPDFGKIVSLTKDSIIVTAPGESADFVSRFFAPGLGIDEDPVTGAAHCVLTPYWAKRLNKKSFKARQISQRGGELDCELRDDRVLLRGHARFYLEGKLTV
jgi:PhzF family phenazine biosynthesis protein